MSEFFPQLSDCPRHEIFPGVVVRTAWLDRLMTSLVEFAPGAVVENHHHPHEQMGIMLSGRAEFTIGPETRTLVAGDTYRIPSNVWHKVVAIDPVRAFDVFSPPREEYQ